jgi:HTH-type transcriptional regulator/antitoxin HigA
MEFRSIKTTADYERALTEIRRLWNAKPGTADAERLEVLGALVEVYEAKVYPLPDPDPIDVIKYVMDQRGLTRAALLPIFGTTARVSEVLNRKRPLTLEMIRKLRRQFKIPLELLVGEARGSRPHHAAFRAAQ